MNLDNLFSEETLQLHLIREEITDEISSEKFDEFLIEIDECVMNSYKSDNEDIEDLDDIFTIMDNIIYKLWTSKENYEKFYNIIFSRKKAKKLIHKKLREAHDFLFKNEIENGTVEKKIIYHDEVPRNIFNIHECVNQYSSFLEHNWYPSLDKIKKFCADNNFLN
jgi:hypothetical protein